MPFGRRVARSNIFRPPLWAQARTPLFDARSGDESQGLVIDRCEEDMAVRKVLRVAVKHMGEHRCHLGSATCLTAIGRGSSRLDASRRDVGINSLRNP